ncbi:YqgE/AlgH family protein [Aestuariicoccus sp. MJ-SS9]|uniref:YqgE/AlgH family protein n=1 Tax=Aestuariicoccus sp. MJ-SS9 TaxID=3079855 RepID=UPI00290C38D4|nr:YqgE/AlgH family protein [Aestuariicoccus sp. MJ-SS9]MDU8911747.1 YqgE/AlgH family protein [Aestuariicoccus sp. MJ-SS9]
MEHADGITQTTDLTGKMLIAMPGMGDPRFDQSLVFMCAHGSDGAMGLIVNKPASDVSLSMLLKQLDIETTGDPGDQKVHYGGPVETARGFVLHSPEYASAVTTLEAHPRIHMTATLDILEDIAVGKGPDKRLMMLGYAGWGPGQLESEIAQNGWLVCDASPALVFDVPADQKWTAALESLGVAALALSSEGGRA